MRYLYREINRKLTVAERRKLKERIQREGILMPPLWTNWTEFIPFLLLVDPN